MIEVSGLRRCFGAVEVLRRIDFDVPAGKICGFVGPNGAGKTTTMRILATLDLPDAGSVQVDGLDVVQQAQQVRGRVGFMPDYYGAYPDLNVRDYVDFFARAQRLPRAERERRVVDVTEFTELSPLLERPVEGLSKGQKQRLSLARTLLADPGLLILDEPAAGLDPRARVELRELLVVLSERGKTIFISSHILGELSDLIDWLVVIDDGVVRHCGPPQAAGEPSAGRTYVLELGSDEAAARRLLLEQPCVLSIAGGEGQLVLQLQDEPNEVPELVATMAAAGVRIQQLYRREENLEDLFLSLTKGRQT
jgi:ABC-2 type transport system ATP-binding protein